MHRCGSSTSAGGGSRASQKGRPCACGLFHAPGSSFCVLFAVPTSDQDEELQQHFGGCPSPVDCTLSLGTPSTRRGSDHDQMIMSRQRRRHHPGAAAAAAAGTSTTASCLSNFCWDILQARQQDITGAAAIMQGTSQYNIKSGRAAGGGGSSSSSSTTTCTMQQLNNNLGSDTLLARRCANCDTTSTPLWRNGPRGPKSLCNACGIRYKKEERRASSTVVEMNHQHCSADPYAWGTTTFAGPASHDQSHHHMMKAGASAASASAEFRLIREDDDSGAPDVSFLSWRLNVRDRPGLLHDFT